MFTLIIPVLQTKEILQLFIDSLCQTIKFTTDIIFIDDGSPSDTKQILERCSKERNAYINNVTILYHRHSEGCAKCINEALQIMPDCSCVVFMDSDLILTDNWQALVLDPFNEEKVGIVGGVLLYPQTGGIQCCGIAFNQSVGRHLFLNNNPRVLYSKKPFIIQSTVFAFCAVRASAIKQVGLLDENFFNGYEDFDYQFRIREKGYIAITNPNIILYHWETSCGPHRAFNRKSNLGRFWEKHSSFVYSDILEYIVPQIEIIKDKKYLLVDLCEGRTEAKQIIDRLNREDIIIEYMDYSYFSSDGSIWIPKVLGSSYYLSNDPIIFLCDHFIKLTDNMYWWNIRSQTQSDDLVLDLYANLIRFDDLQKSFWPGNKIR